MASVFAGVGVATQSRLNGELGLELGNGSLAALISFSSGLLILTTAMMLSRSARQGIHTVVSGIRSGSLPWWSIFGGVAGGFLVLTQGLVAGVLGVAVFSVAVVAGQTLGALGIDSRGLVGMPRVRLSPVRVWGALLVIAGVVASSELAGNITHVPWQFFLPLAAGIGTGFQQAVNGTVRRYSGSPLTATFINFAMGTSVLAVIALIMSPTPFGGGQFPTDWWLYLGGLVGTIFIAIQTVTVSRIGVLGLGVSLVTGQIIGSLFFDVFAPIGEHPVTPLTLAGAALTVIGSVLVTLSKRRAG